MHTHTLSAIVPIAIYYSFYLCILSPYLVHIASSNLT